MESDDLDEDFDADFFANIDKVVEQYKANKALSQHITPYATPPGSPVNGEHSHVERDHHRQRVEQIANDVRGVDAHIVLENDAPQGMGQTVGGPQGMGQPDVSKPAGGQLRWEAVGVVSRVAAQMHTKGPMQSPHYKDHVKENHPMLAQAGQREKQMDAAPSHRATMMELQHQIHTYKQQLMFKEQEIEELKRQRQRPTNESALMAPGSVRRQRANINMDSNRDQEKVSKSETKKRTAESLGSPGQGGDEHPLECDQHIMSTRHTTGRVDSRSASMLVPLIRSMTFQQESSSFVECIREQKQEIISLITYMKKVAQMLHKARGDTKSSFGFVDTLQAVIDGTYTSNPEEFIALLLQVFEHGFHNNIIQCVLETEVDEKLRQLFIEAVCSIFDLLSCIVSIPHYVEIFVAMVGLNTEDVSMRTPLLIASLSHMLEGCLLLHNCHDNGGIALEHIMDFLLLLSHTMNIEIIQSLFILLKDTNLHRMLLSLDVSSDVKARVLHVVTSVMRYDRQAIVSLENDVSQSLKVPSGLVGSDRDQTPSKTRSKTSHRKNSMLEKRLESASPKGRKDSNSWGLDLIFSISSQVHIGKDGTSNTSDDCPRTAMALFALLLERGAFVSIRAVIDFMETVSSESSLLRDPTYENLMVPLPQRLILLADGAAGRLGISFPLIPATAPQSDNRASRRSQIRWHKNIRLIQESLTLLRGFILCPALGVPAMDALLSATDIQQRALCALEKASKMDRNSSIADDVIFGYPVSPWVQAIGTSSAKASLCPETISSKKGTNVCSVEDVVYLSKSIKSRILVQLSE